MPLMNNFDITINTALEEDWKSNLAAAGLAGATMFSGTSDVKAQPQSTITQPVNNHISLSTLLKTLERVESNGNSKAIGDNGKAKGILQIWNVVVKDVNRVYKTKYTHDDSFNPDIARDIASKYLTFWGKQYQKKTGEIPTYEVLSRIWNGGPSGYKKDATLKYWDKVKKLLG